MSKLIEFLKLVANAVKNKDPKVLKDRRVQAIIGLLLLCTILAVLKIRYDRNQATTIDTGKLVDKIGKLIELPADETPTIALVSDVDKLQNQAFFAKAQNGDQVLIYTKAKKVILYRPSINKLIEVAPLAPENVPNQTSQ